MDLVISFEFHRMPFKIELYGAPNFVSGWKHFSFQLALEIFMWSPW